MKNDTRVTLYLSFYVIGDYNYGTNFFHKLSLTDTQVHRAFANNSSTNIKLSKTQPSGMVQLEGFLGWDLRPLLKTGLPLIKNVL